MTTDVKRGPQCKCWDRGDSEPLFRVWINEAECLYMPFFSLLAGNYAEDKKLRLEFPIGRITIEGPRVEEFGEAFSKNRATSLRAIPGEGIDAIDFAHRDNRPEIIKQLLLMLEGKSELSEAEKADLLADAKEESA